MSGKVKYHQLSKEEREEYLGMFYSMVEGLKTREEIKSFFKDLLTLSESVMIARRLKIAILLLEGKTQDQIRKKLRVGLTTINNVERWLHNGFGGYEKTIEKYKKAVKKKEKQDEWLNVSPMSFEYIKKKYPLHFLLCNALAEFKGKIKNKKDEAIK